MELLIDRWFKDPHSVRDQALKLSYEGVRNPLDQILYPDISIDLPSDVLAEHHQKLVSHVGPFKSSIDFIRLSTKGVHAPHQAHTDLVMGDLTVITYLNLPEHCEGGTSLVTHETGMTTHPRTEEEMKLWIRDTNDPSKWTIRTMFPMAFNRTAIMNSICYHRSEPIGGFGSTVEDGRLVLVSFLRI